MGEHWFEPVADHLGPAYLRYSFTKGTEQEVAFLVEALGLQPGDRVLDVGCGPGRHAHALARLGITVHGVDISERFVDLARHDAPPGATFERLDARVMAFDAGFDLALSLCQGAFGLAGAGPGTEADVVAGPAIDPDGEILARMAAAVRPGGHVVLSAFSAYFAVRFMEPQDTFDVARGVNHETTKIMDADGLEVPAELWTSCFTPRELRLLASAAGLEVDAIWGATPGGYSRREPGLEDHELLLIARRASLSGWAL